MRVSCFFVTVAILLAEKSNAVPILGLVDLPVLPNTLNRISLTKDLNNNLLENESGDGLISTNELIGHDGLISTDATLDQITGSLRRRQGLPLVNTLGPVVKGLTAPVTQGLNSKVGSFNDAFPDLKKVTTGTTNAVAPLHIKRPSILKREGSLPFLGTVPILSSIPILKEVGSLPGIKEVPTLDAVPGYNDKIQVFDYIPGFTSLEAIGDAVPMTGLTKRDGSIPGLDSIPFIGSFSSGHLPDFSSIPFTNDLPLIGKNSAFKASNIPAIGEARSIAATLPIPNFF